MAALGLIMAVASLSGFHGTALRIRETADNMKKLIRLRDLAACDDAALRAFKELPSPHPAPIADLLKDALPGQKYDTREPQSRPTVEGWAVRRIEISFADIQLKSLAAFLSRAATQKPPWMLKSCTIRALDPAGNSAQVTVELEALDKTS